MADRAEFRVVGNEVATELPHEHHVYHEAIEEGHFWFHVWEFPRGVFWPVCTCAWMPDDGFDSRDAAIESMCERQRRALLHE